MIESILIRLPYFFGVLGIILILLTLVTLIFGGSGSKKENKFKYLTPGIGFMVLATVLYFLNPFLLSFLNTLSN